MRFCKGGVSGELEVEDFEASTSFSLHLSSTSHIHTLWLWATVMGDHNKTDVE
jgi:hypothetical protein